MMKSYYDRRKSLAESLKLPNLQLNLGNKENEKVQNIIDETPLADLLVDVDKMRTEDGKLLFTNGDYEVFFSKSEDIPSLIREIGRQREITFREIGEGTNLPFDLDEYDKHYHHLILWDHKNQKLSGAYRMALGAEVMKKFGIDGFYTSSLFEFDPEIHPFFPKLSRWGVPISPKNTSKNLCPCFYFGGVLFMLVYETQIINF